MDKEIHELLVRYKYAKHKGIEAQVEAEIDRRLKAFDWYNKNYHLPDELKHLEKGVSLKERKL